MTPIESQGHREHIGLTLPHRRVGRDFPGWLLSVRRHLKRAHQITNGPWWFSSAGGRFDLKAPLGTCYLALDSATAIRECVGEILSSSGVISEEFAQQRCVSTLSVPVRLVLADCCAERAADFGLTREISTLTPYRIPQAWAMEFSEIFSGILYQSRFTTGSKANSIGIFGESGAGVWKTDSAPTSFALEARRLGFQLVSRPRSVRIISPPIDDKE